MAPQPCGEALRDVDDADVVVAVEGQGQAYPGLGLQLGHQLLALVQGIAIGIACGLQTEQHQPIVTNTRFDRSKSLRKMKPARKGLSGSFRV